MAYYPPAYMGYVGYVQLKPEGEAYTLRVTSADISLKQEVNAPDVIDSRYDRTVYQLGPKEIDGSIAFPAVYDESGGADIIRTVYNYAVTRLTPDGSLGQMDIDVRYAPGNTWPNQADFTYTGCVINSWQFSVAQSDMVNITVEVIGEERLEPGMETSDNTFEMFNAFNFSDTTTSDGSYTAQENTRVITWNDARIEITPGRGDTATISGEFVRTFEANINNNAERFYTLNGQLFPQAIAPTKRDVNGNVGIMGRHIALAALARDNQWYSFEESTIAFGFVPTVNTASDSTGQIQPVFGVLLPNIVFKIEEMALTNDLFETTMNWICMPAAGTFTEFDDPLSNSEYAFNY
jgi:hypothetical protein